MIKKIFLVLKSIKNIHLFILDYLGLKKGDLLYKLKNGTEIIVRSGSSDGGEVVIINSDLEYPEKYFPKNNNPIILDVGANIGAFSIYANKVLQNKTPLIYSIEPSSDNFDYLVKNIKLNGLNEQRCFKLAISNKNDLCDLDISTGFDSFCLTTKELKKSSKNKIEQVLTQTLDNFCSKNNIKFIDLLKIDIEGEEYCVFDKSLEFIKESVGIIFIELHRLDNERNIENFKKKISKHGFKVIKSILGRTLILKNTNQV